MNIQQFLHDYTACRKLNGTIMVANGYNIVAEQNLGFADFNSKVACQRNTQYQIGSVTKQFTAVAVLKVLYNLAINSGISKDDTVALVRSVTKLLYEPIAHFLPEKSSWWSNKMPSWAQEVTMHHLLQHSSGIPSYTSFPEYKEKFFNTPPSKIELIGYFKDKELEFTPGAMFSYCNSGYILLGAIVAEVTKCSLYEYLEQNIFQPLGLHNTAFPESGTVKDLKLESKYRNLARGYEFNVAMADPDIYEVKRYLPMQVPGPAGSMISNVPDLLTWNNALFSGKVMPSFLLDLMLDSVISTGAEDGFYAYGLEGKTSAAIGKYYFHGGGIDGYKSMLVYIPQLNMSIICLTNLVGGGDEFWLEVEKINARLPHTLTAQEKSMQLKDALKNKFPFLEHNKDRYNATVFSDTLIAELEKE